MAKRIVYTIVILIALFAAFYAGGVLGFYQGYSYSVLTRSTTDSHEIVSALESIQGRRHKEAQDKLELMLDSQLVQHWSLMDYRPVISFNLMPAQTDAHRKIMSRVVAYRKAHATKETNPVMGDCISAVVRRYSPE